MIQSVSDHVHTCLDVRAGVLNDLGSMMKILVSGLSNRRASRRRRRRKKRGQGWVHGGRRVPVQKRTYNGKPPAMLRMQRRDEIQIKMIVSSGDKVPYSQSLETRVCQQRMILQGSLDTHHDHGMPTSGRGCIGYCGIKRCSPSTPEKQGCSRVTSQ